MGVFLDEAEVGGHTFTDLRQFERVEIPLALGPGSHRLELRYSAWDRSDPQARAVLFRKLKVLSETGPGSSDADPERP
jgi:hypothetical protein